jgi:uncharacterized protein (TIGR03435 family)
MRSLAGLLTAGALTMPQQSFAQAAVPPPDFEVASIKEAPVGPNGVKGGCHGTDSAYSPSQQASIPPLGRCVITDARLSHLIGIAYGVGMLDLKTGPDWIQRGDLRFNVQAKAQDPAHTTERQLLAMLQNLLAERFRLKFHYEASQAAGFALTVDRSGTKLKASRSEDTTISFAGPNGEKLFRPVPGQPVSMTARKYSITSLINVLSLMGNGAGLDKTGLTGEYDFTLSWDEGAGPNLSTAVREQLGLRLDTTSVPVSTFVVDSAQRPSPD